MTSALRSLQLSSDRSSLFSHKNSVAPMLSELPVSPKCLEQCRGLGGEVDNVRAPLGWSDTVPRLGLRREVAEGASVTLPIQALEEFIGSALLAPKAIQMTAGTIVEVLKAFTSNAEEKVPLPVGTQGNVVGIDEDGDAEVEFVGFDKFQWVFAENFANLKIRSQAETEKFGFAVDEEVHGADGSIGTVVGFTIDLVRVELPQGTFVYDPTELHKGKATTTFTPVFLPSFCGGGTAGRMIEVPVLSGAYEQERLIDCRATDTVLFRTHTSQLLGRV